jgi:hypothetical protein
MDAKGISQVDFAIAAGMFLLLFASLMIFTTNYFYSLRNDALIVERQSFASGLMNDLFSTGFPSNWESDLQEFSNNTAANWSRSLARSTNTTIAIFGSGELGSVDGIYGEINESQTADALELTFPALGIPDNASIGNVSLKVYYNASYFRQTPGSGDYDDDMSYFKSGSETYMNDWGMGTTGNQFLWWNSSDLSYEISNATFANGLLFRLYYIYDFLRIVYFDQINISVIYSYYPYYPVKLGLADDSYNLEVLLNNTVDDLPNEKVSVNLSLFGYDDIDENSVIVYNSTDSAIACNISNRLVSFNANISNNTYQWFTVRFSRNLTSNFSTAACGSTIGGDDNLTIANRNETIYPVHRAKTIQYKKLYALNRSFYGIMKGVSDSNHDFHITLKDSSGISVLEYGPDIPRKGDVNGIQKYVLYQNSTAGINQGRLMVFVW